MSEKPRAIAGTRRALRELVDGTIRVQIDFDPRYRRDVFDLLGEIDMPVAVAPLVPEAVDQQAHGWKALGPLAQSAILLCREPAFQQFVASYAPLDESATPEEHAASYVRSRCGVASRKELDTTDGARERFGAMMADYRSWLTDHQT